MVETSCLESSPGESLREFESHPFRFIAALSLRKVAQKTAFLTKLREGAAAYIYAR